MWKTLSDPDDNADEDPAGRVVDFKPATWQSKWYNVRSNHPCVKSKSRVVYQGNNKYWEYECKDYAVGCSGPGNRCEPSGYTYIPALKKSVISGCRCASS